ncbi:MAG: type VI secretion system protein TssA [Pyrinomonadaceae bacterium]
MSSVSENVSASAPPVIDVESLLAPVPGESPAGRDLRHEGLYDQIEHERRADDEFGQGEWVRETKAADWDAVAALAREALATRTKDIKVCAWMAEALVKLHGFAGLRDSLRVMRGLHERYWEGLFPDKEDDDLDARVNAVSLMQRQTAAALRGTAVTASGLGYAHWEESNAFNVGPEVDSDVADERRARAARDGKVTSEEWLKQKTLTPRRFYETARATVEECFEEVRALDLRMDELYGRDAPSLTDLKKSLEAVGGVVERIVKEKRMSEPWPDDGAAPAADPPAAEPAAQPQPAHTQPASSNGDGGAAVTAQPVVTTPAVAGPVGTRQDAVRRLGEVAAFFRQTEPHSPVAYLVERAVRWSEMPLEVWLASVIKDDGVMRTLRETLGVDGKSDGD